MDPHVILGVSKDATKEQIRKRYIVLVNKFHPDRNPGHENELKQINLAYDILVKNRKTIQSESSTKQTNPNPKTINITIGLQHHFWGFTYTHEGVKYNFPSLVLDNYVFNFKNGDKAKIHVRPEPPFFVKDNILCAIIKLEERHAKKGCKVKIPYYYLATGLSYETKYLSDTMKTGDYISVPRFGLYTGRGEYRDSMRIYFNVVPNTPFLKRLFK